MALHKCALFQDRLPTFRLNGQERWMSLRWA